MDVPPTHAPAAAAALVIFGGIFTIIKREMPAASANATGKFRRIVCETIQPSRLILYTIFISVSMIIISLPLPEQAKEAIFYMRYLFIPDFLLDMELSPRAVLAAGLILSRLNLSAVNGDMWRDDFGVFCYYSVDELAADLHIDRRQASRIIAELSEAKVIDRIREDSRKYKIYAGRVCYDKNVMADMTKMSSQYTIYSNIKNSNSCTHKKLIPDGIPATYDISLYESSSVIDDDMNGGADE